MDRTIEQPKACRTCGTMMERRRFNGRLECNSAFQKRQFCTLSCANTRETLTKHGYSWRARKHLKSACEACGETRLLHAHHIDQDKTNNETTNIQTLCKFCHDFWHSAAKRLGREIAGRMPALWLGGQPSQKSLGSPLASPIGHTESAHWATAKSRSKRPTPGSRSAGRGKG